MQLEVLAFTKKPKDAEAKGGGQISLSKIGSQRLGGQKKQV